MRLDFETLYNECRTDAFDQGKKLYYDDQSPQTAAVEEDGKSVIRGNIRGKEAHEIFVAFDEQGGLYDYGCDCEDFTASDGPCRHIVAAALAFEERNPSRSVGEFCRGSDVLAIKLIDEYSRLRYNRTLPDSVKTELTPCLCFTDGKILVKLTVAKTRGYKIKNIAEFARCYFSGSYKRYGVELAFVHSPVNFTPFSAKLAALIAAAAGPETGDTLTLAPGDADDLMNLYAGRAVECRSVLFPTVTRPIIGDFRPVLKLRKQRNGYTAELVPAAYSLAEGRAYTYALAENGVYRCAASSTALPLVRAFASAATLFISASDMTGFYNDVVLPTAGEIDVDSDDDLTEFAVPPLTAELYLDCENGAVKGRLETRYDTEVDIFGGGPQTNSRDADSERRLKRILTKYFPSAPDFTLTNEDEIFILLREGLQEIYRYAEIFLRENFKNLRGRQAPRVRVGVKLRGSLLDLSFAAEDYTDAELTAVIDAAKAGKKYVRLGDGSFIDLKDRSLTALSEITYFAGGDALHPRLPLRYGRFLREELSDAEIPSDLDVSFARFTDAASAAQPPAPLNEVLRGYQRTGFAWLKALIDNDLGGILGDDMGLGKSVQLIALMLTMPGVKLIVCPTTLILNWKNEIAKFAPSLKVTTVTGAQEERAELIKNIDSCDVAVTSYELLRRDAPLYETHTFTLAAADEAQYVKNPATKSARAIKLIKAEHRLALTGTPIENGLSELWSIFDFVMPGYLGSYRDFRARFEVPINDGSERAARELRLLVGPFILRRLKGEVLKELPPKIESTICAPLEGEQRLVYAAHLSELRNSLKAGEHNKIVVLGMLTKLRQICCDPSLVDPSYRGNSAKLETCIELVATSAAAGHKVLVFSQFTSMLDILEKKLRELRLSYYTLKGDTPKADRVKLVSRFNGDATPVFLISLKAGGTGLNLTGADVVIHYDPWWNDSVMSQATDRAYRIGQSRSVQVFRLTLEDTVEKKIAELQRKKTALGSLMIGGEKGDDLSKIIELIN